MEKKIARADFFGTYCFGAPDADCGAGAVQKDADGIVWRSAKHPDFGIYGSGALGEEGFCRLTAAERDVIRPVNDGEAWLGEHSAGIQVRFETDSSRIVLRARMRSPFNMTNMTMIGQCGAALLVYDERTGTECLHEVANFPFDAREYELSVGHFEGKKKLRRFRLFFPLYNAVESFEIGLDEDASVRPVGFADGTRYAIYGTSITQGCSASNPATAYSNLLSLRLDAEVLNFGFSGAAFMEPEMAEILSGRKPDWLFVDTEANAGVDGRLMERAEEFLRVFWKNSPETVVVLYSRVLFALDLYDDKRTELHIRYNEFLKKLAARQRRAGKPVYFADGSRIFPGNFTLYTADGVHPSDAGMMLIAQDYERTIARIRKSLARKNKND